MDAKDNLMQLLADESFQEDIRNPEIFSKDQRKAILAKYSISEKEFLVAKRFLSGFSFKQEGVKQEEIDYALKRLEKQLTASSISSSVSKVKRVDFVSIVLRVAAILFIPLLLSTIYFYRQTLIVNTEYRTLSAQEKIYKTFTASQGAKTQVVLPDGSLVWLNSGSSLRCPMVFGSKLRQVELKGEAYFEVVKNEAVPMVVSTQHLKVKVYGTKFNVNAFVDNGVVETTLVEGKVTLIPGTDKKEYEVKPGFTASYAIQNRELVLEKVDNMDVFTGWKDGKLIFNNEHFTDIVTKLERWYNVDIKLTDTELGNYTLYATFIDENIEQILDIFSNSIPISMTYVKRIRQGDGSYSKRQIIIGRDQNKK